MKPFHLALKTGIALQLIALLAIAFTGQTSAHDQYLNMFPACPGPTGTLKVHYDSGTHAIVGDQNLHEGSDSVYWIDNGNALQCFCPPAEAPETQGIQTNWLDTNNVDETTKQTLQNEGWIFVEDASVWDLGAKSFLAFNKQFSCKAPVATPTGEVTPTTVPPQGGDVPTPTQTPSSNNPSNNGGNGDGGSSSSKTGGSSTPVVLGASTLAPTGTVENLAVATVLVLTGALSLSYGILFKKTA